MTKQVIIFDNVTGSTEQDCNNFLLSLPKMPKDLIQVQSHYNTILGGIVFVVVFPKL